MTPEQVRAIEFAIRAIGHNLETLCDAVYWLKASPEDKANVIAIKDNTREALFTLYQALNEQEPTP